MPRAGFLPQSVRGTGGDLPELPIENMLPVAAITEPEQFALISRPGLSETATELGAGPIQALFQADGVLSGVVVAVSGGDLYVDGANVGTIPGTGPASIAGNQMGVVVTRGSAAKFYDGTAFRSIAFPDNADVSKVTEQGGRFVFLRADTHRYYWTEPLSNMLDGSGDIVIDGLDFASAESEPDKLVDVVVFEDHLVLGGISTIEFHGETGDDNAPWSPTLGRVFTKGVRATGCLTIWDNVPAWVSPQNIVYRYNGAQSLQISDEGLHRQIADSVTCSVDSFFYGAKEFLRVKLDDVDILLDPVSYEPFEWKTDGGSFVGGPTLLGPIFGSTLDGKILELSGNDELGDELTRLFRAGVPMDGGNVTVNNLVLRANPGNAAVGSLSVDMRYSRDGGRTWTGYFPASLGSNGEYRTLVEWRSLGMFDQPGALFEFRFTGDAELRCSGVVYNEPMNGRSR